MPGSAWREKGLTTMSAVVLPPSEVLSVIILGCGRVGSTLARQLSREGHSVTVIDSTGDAFRRLGPKFKGQRIVGTGLDQDILRKAGLEHADVFIAVTQGDNSNIMAAQIAREVFLVSRVIARIYDPIRAQAYREMGILTLCTTTLAAGLIHAQALGEPDSGPVMQAAENADCAYLEMIG
jgi:trk system potassium uptake protein TrkA